MVIKNGTKVKLKHTRWLNGTIGTYISYVKYTDVVYHKVAIRGEHFYFYNYQIEIAEEPKPIKSKITYWK